MEKHAYNVDEIDGRLAPLFAVDRYVPPFWTANSLIKKQHILTFRPIFQKQISKFADKKTADNEVR